MTFDVRTIGLLSGVLPVMLSAIMAIYLNTRRVYPGFGRWVLSNFLLGIGFLCVDLRGIIPDFFSIIVGNILIIYCLVLVCEGLQLFFERPLVTTWNYAVFALYIVLQFYFTYAIPNVNVRVVIASAASVFFHLRGAYILWNFSPPRLRQTARSAAGVFFISTLVGLSRGIYTIGLTQPVDMITDQFLFWYALVFLLSLIGWTYCFFLLNSARLELELEDAHHELEQIASHDSLTGVLNRRYFYRHAEVELQRAKRSQKPLSFLEIDVDNFKSINDTYGHDVGDEVMIYLVRIFKENLRLFDLISRFGGDEYFIMLWSVDESQALEIARRIYTALNRAPLIHDNLVLQINISMGLTAYVAGETELEPILKRTDVALYRAKNEGRNHVVVG